MSWLERKALLLSVWSTPEYSAVSSRRFVINSFLHREQVEVSRVCVCKNVLDQIVEHHHREFKLRFL